LHQIAHVGSARAEALSYSAVKIFRSIQSCVKNIPQRHGWTDGRTDGRLIVA